MKGFIATRAFKHGKHYKMGDVVDINPTVNKALELRGLVRWYERSAIIMPKKKVEKPTHKKKRNVRKSKNDV